MSPGSSHHDLQAYFTAQSQLDCRNYSQRYHRLITEQNDIGWNNFLREGWTKEWHRLHARYLKEGDPEAASPEKALQWASGLVRKIWDHWFVMWTDRNKTRHGRDAATRHAAERAQAIHEIRQLYTCQYAVDEEYTFIFHTPLAELLKQTTPRLQQWISLWEPIINPPKEPKQQR